MIYARAAERRLVVTNRQGGRVAKRAFRADQGPSEGRPSPDLGANRASESPAKGASYSWRRSSGGEKQAPRGG